MAMGTAGLYSGTMCPAPRRVGSPNVATHTLPAEPRILPLHDIATHSLPTMEALLVPKAGMSCPGDEEILGLEADSRICVVVDEGAETSLYRASVDAHVWLGANVHHRRCLHRRGHRQSQWPASHQFC